MDEKLIDERFKNQEKTINDHESRIKSLEKTYSIMQKMELRVGYIEESVDTINQKLDSQSKEKGMKWDKLIDYLLYAILAYCLYKLGLK